MTKVKILGAGSIGNHLSNASRSLGWQVDLCDTDPAALARTQNEIYPARYGKWDDGIRLFEYKDAPTSGYDLILAKNLRNSVNVPISIMGGAGNLNDMKSLFNACGVVGAIAGSLFVFKGALKAVLINYPSGIEKDSLVENN